MDVILHNAPNNSIFLLRKDGTVDYWPEDVKDALIKPSTLYLFNPDEKDAQAFLSFAFTVIATSPDEKHYSNFTKLPDMDVYFLAPWTLDEAVHANNALPPNQRQEESTLRERFDMFGGYIRLLLSSATMYITALNKMSELWNELSLEKLQKWRDLIQDEKSVGDSKAPHYVFHCQPNKENGGITRILRVAANKTVALILQHIEIKSAAEWPLFVKFMLQFDSSSSSLGSRFENFFHAFMESYKDSFKLRVLNNELELDSVLEKIPVYKRSKTPEQDVANALANSTCTYVVPSQPNYPAIDSFYVDGTTVYCFQVTTSGDHRFKPDKYTEKIKLIEEKYQQAVEAKAKAKGKAKPEVKALTFKYCWVVDPTDTKPPLGRQPDQYHIHVNNVYSSRSSLPNDEVKENQQ